MNKSKPPASAGVFVCPLLTSQFTVTLWALGNATVSKLEIAGLRIR